MAFILADRVEETTATAGTGPLALAGASPGGFRTFGSVMATGDTTRYAYLDAAAGVWEVGLGTFTAGSPSTLSRAPAATSAGGTAPIALPGNPAARVFITPDAGYFAGLAPLVDPYFPGDVSLVGRILCRPLSLGRKLDVFDDGTRSYGIGLNASELAFYAGDNAAHRFRIGTQGPDAPVVATITATGINGTPVGADAPAAGRFTTLAATDGSASVDTGTNPYGATLGLLSRGGAGLDLNINLVTQSSGPNDGLGSATAKGWTFVARSNGNAFSQANYLLWSFWNGAAWNECFRLQPDGALQLSALYLGSVAGGSKGAGTVNAAALYVGGVDALDGAAIGTNTPAAGRFSTLFSANVDLEGGAIDNTPIGTTTAAAGRFTTLALTGSQTSKFVLIAPNAANGAPTWRQILSTDISGLGTLATANAATPPALGDTTANTGRFSTLTATGFLLRSMATGLTASTTNTQAGALALTAQVNNITTAAANSAVRLPNAAPATGTAAEIIVRNGGANATNCFPVSGAAINALAANASISIPAGTAMRFMQLSATLYVTV